MTRTRRPLLRCLLLGTALFALDEVRAAMLPAAPAIALPADASDEDVLFAAALERGYHQSDAIVRRRLARNMRFAGGDPERSDAELVDDAIALGMHESDIVVRRRLAQKMALLTHEQARIAPPSDTELLAYLEANRARWTEPERRRIDQIFFDDEASARATRPRLPAPPDASIATLGDPLPLPRTLPPHSQAELAARFGPDFAVAAMQPAPGSWSEPIRSAYGWHLIYVHEHRPAHPSDLETVRGEVREALLAERGEARLQEELARLRARYGIEDAG
jgi:hypothetical protein